MALPFAVEVMRLPATDPPLVVVALPFAVEVLRLPATDPPLVVVALPFAVEVLRLPPIGPELVVVAVVDEQADIALIGDLVVESLAPGSPSGKHKRRSKAG